MQHTISVALVAFVLLCGQSDAGCSRQTHVSRPVPSNPGIASTLTSPIASRFFTKQKPFAIIPKMPNPGYSYDLSSCPHQQSGLQDWHKASTWPSGKVPTSGSVTITNKVLISACSLSGGSVFDTITIQAGGELVFADAPISMSIKMMKVYGRLSIGAETCRYDNTIKITFVQETQSGTRTNGIEVRGSGTLDMHGRLFFPTWSRLAAPVEIGDTVIAIEDKVNWEVGQEIVLVTSVWRDEEDPQNEVHTIKGTKAASGGRTFIQLDAPTKFAHYAGVDYQTEVGLLSRTLQVRGSDASETSKMGGHIKIIGSKATGRFEGVNGYRMGQLNRLGFYPFHLHLLEDGSNSYVRDCSCKHSYWRCVTVHGTNNTHVERNVAFDVTGHTYYLEDGVEMDNYIQYNLGAYVHTVGKPAEGGVQDGEMILEITSGTTDPTKLLMKPDDRAASVFYFPNPYNTIVGNAASGGWTGFGFPIFKHPTGAYKQLVDYPLPRVNTKKFDGNTAHSTGYQWDSGSCVYSGGELTYQGDKLLYNSGRNDRDTRDNIYDTGEAWMVWSNLKVWMCNRGANTWGRRLNIEHYEAYDFNRGAVLFGESSIREALIVGHSGNPNLGKGIAYARENTGFRLYDTIVKTILYKITFRHFYPTGTERCIGGTVHSDVFKPWWITSSASLEFEYVDPSVILEVDWIETGSARMFNMIDWDGTLTQQSTKQAKIVGSNLQWWRYGDDCYQHLGWGSWICPHTAGRSVVGMYIEVPEGAARTYRADFRTTGGVLSAANKNKYYIGSITHFGKKDHTIPITVNHIMSGLSGLGWYMNFNPMVNGNRLEGTPSKLSLKPTEWPPGQFVVVALSYPAGTTFKLKRWNKASGKTVNVVDLSKLTSKDALFRSKGDSYYLHAPSGQQQTLYIKMSFDIYMNYPDAYQYKDVWVPETRASYISYEYNIVANCPGLTNGMCPAQFKLPAAVDWSQYINKCTTSSIKAMIADWRDDTCSSEPADTTSIDCRSARMWGKCGESWTSGCKHMCDCRNGPYTCSPTFGPAREYWDNTAPSWTPCHGVVCNTNNPCQLPGKCIPATKKCSYVKKTPGMSCDDSDPNTTDDKCSAVGTCSGTAMVGGLQISKYAGGYWSAVLEINPSSTDVTIPAVSIKVDVGDGGPLRTVACTEVHWGCTRYCFNCKPPTAIQGDIIALVTKEENGQKTVVTQRMADWNYAWERYFRIKEETYSNPWWFDAKISPGDYLPTIKATFSADPTGKVFTIPGKSSSAARAIKKLPFESIGGTGIKGKITGDMYLQIQPTECDGCTENCNCPIIHKTLNCIGGPKNDGGKPCKKEDGTMDVCSGTDWNVCGKKTVPITGSTCSQPQKPLPTELVMDGFLFEGLSGLNGRYTLMQGSESINPTYCLGCTDATTNTEYFLRYSKRAGLWLISKTFDDIDYTSSSVLAYFQTSYSTGGQLCGKKLECWMGPRQNGARQKLCTVSTTCCAGAATSMQLSEPAEHGNETYQRVAGEDFSQDETTDNKVVEYVGVAGILVGAVAAVALAVGLLRSRRQQSDLGAQLIEEEEMVA